MALLNFGNLPGGAVGNELVAETRRAVMPGVVVQIGKASVTASALYASAEPVTGGVSPVTEPLQGTRMVSGGFTDYAGGFNIPQIIPGLLNAEYNLAAFVVGIPMYLFEAFAQMDAEIVPIMWARMNDAGNYTSDQSALALWAALSANNALTPFSINDIFATTNPTQGNVGNIDRAANTFWQANVVTMATITGSTTTAIRANVLAALTSAAKRSGGEPPSCIIASPGLWMSTVADTIGNERFLVTPEGSYGEAAEGVNTGFPALSIGGVPYYSDLYQTDDTSLYFPNFNYLGFKMHAEATFAVAGPESLLPQGQLGYIQAMFVLYCLTCSKCNAQTKVTSITGAFTGV